MQPASARKLYNVFVVTSCAAVIAASMTYILIWHRDDGLPGSEVSAEGTMGMASDRDTSILGAKREDDLQENSSDIVVDASYPMLGMLISKEEWRTGKVSKTSQPYKRTDEWSDGFSK